MEIFVNYDGSSIDILEKDDVNNTLILSPKMENGVFSNYFNFKINNNSTEIGTIYVRNLNKLLFDSSIIPFVRKDTEPFQHIDKSKIDYTTEGMKIKIDVNEKLEISSYPRYVEEDLNSFLESIKNKNISIYDGIVKKITIGKTNKKVIVIIGRQHPGETLSSYFIEGIINEIVRNNQKYEDIGFVIFPIVSIRGVKKGNHRYTQNLDFNRLWNHTGAAEEIDYIKEELKEYDIDCFVDVHCDEISSIDYIRTKNPIIESFCDVKIIEDHKKIIRFFRALIKQRKIIDLSQMTAREYIARKYGCNSMLVELSLKKNDCESSRMKGVEFIKTLKGSKK